MKIDPRFTEGSGREVYTGNELLVKGALETPGGVHLLTGYPGSPVAGFFDACASIGPLLNERGMVARLANNEALSVAMVNGAQMVGCRAMVAFKSVGLHVASDALALGVLAGTKGDGGAVIVCGDDPWSDSTQVPADSRFLAEHVRMPMVEPSGPQEVKDFVRHSFQLAKAGRIYIGYMMTVALADGGGSVEVQPNHYPSMNSEQRALLSYEKDIQPNLDQFVLLPPRSWVRELGLDARHAAVCAEARKLGLNRIIGKPQKGERVPMGFVASGMAYAYLSHALEELGLTGRLPILKLGLSYPLDPVLTRQFAECCEQVIVVEERRSFVEKQLREILQPLQQRGELNTQVWGKQFPRNLDGIPSTRGLHPSLLIERLVPLIKDHPTLPVELTNGRLTGELKLIERSSEGEVSVPLRTPTFCPGCPHRDSSSVLLDIRKDFLSAEYMQRHHKRPPVDLVAHGDTGCYTMLMFEPTTPLMHNYSGMGLGGGTGAGVDPFIENKQLVFMGDGTFYHSGQVAISQSIANNQDIAYIILDNKTTAMTGHQPHAGVELGLTGQPMNAMDIERVVKGMVPRKSKASVHIVRVDPADRDAYRRTLESALLEDGVKVIVADKECGITRLRREKREQRKLARELGYLPKSTHMNVAEETCEFCLECTTRTGCPGLKIVETDYGSKMQTDFSWCVNDQACSKIHACPSFEEVTITRKQPPRSGDEYVNLNDIPDAPRPVHADQPVWRCHVAGVGGMGIGVTTSILVTAGNAMGYQVQFFDKKGLAIRNGGVYSQLLFTRNGKGAVSTPVIPWGKSDLLLGVDMLEAVRCVDPKQPYRVATPDKTAAVVNTARTPTILSLMGRDDFRISDLEDTLRKQVHADRFFGFNVGDLCERLLDSKLYGNIMMLGMAYQAGYLPLTLASLEEAIRKIVPHEVDRNLRAFHIGRKIVVRPDLFVVEARHQYESSRQAFRRKTNMLRAQFGGKGKNRVARQFRILLRRTFEATRGMMVPDQLRRDVVIRAYDCVIWGGIKYAQRYCHRLVDIFQKDVDGGNHDYAITRAVVWNLAKVMLIKDEPYVAAMLTSPEKYKRDQRRYKVNPARGDKITYRHHNRPEFVVFGRSIRFEVRTTDWQLNLMKRCGWLRKLLPGWHKKERDFRDWYEQLVDRAEWSNDAEYRKWLAILSVPEAVTGYREVRYPKMAAAQAKAEALMSGEQTPDQGGQGATKEPVVVSLSDRVMSHT
jgi:indolepyruvate ferredoxin oxidoreductase